MHMSHPFLCDFFLFSEPASGPDLSVLGHENKMIKILWEKLPVNQQRGFIRNYTLYIQALDTGDKELRGKKNWALCLFCFVFSMEFIYL